MDRFAEQSKVQVSEDDIRTWVARWYETGALNDTDLKNLGKDRDQLRNIMLEIRRTKALDLLAEKAKFVAKSAESKK